MDKMNEYGNSKLMPENRGEHAIMSPQNQISDSDMSSEDQAIVKMVMDLWDQAKEDRKKYDQHWKKYKDYYNGKQWEKIPPSYIPSPSINVIRSTIETMLPLMTDTSPGFDVIAKRPQDYQFSETLSKTIHDWWNKRSMDSLIPNVLKDSMVVDVGIAKVVWDEKLENGLGDIQVTRISPDDVWVNPGSNDFDINCDYVIERSYKTVGELKKLFPDKADKIRTTGDKKDNKAYSDDNSFNSVSKDIVFVSPTDRKSPLRTSANFSGTNTSEYIVVEVLEVWLKDYTIEQYELENEESKTRYKYPGGRLITIIPGQRLMLQDAGNPYKHQRFPYVKFIDCCRPGEFYGQGEIEPLIEVQNLINKTMQIIYNWANSMTNPVWILDSDSGVDPEMLTNQVGLIVTKKRGSDVRREMGVALPPQVFELYGQLQAIADQISGVNDVTQGRKPIGITAAEALQTMQDAAQTRIRLKSRNMEVSLSRMGELVVSLMMQYYTDIRVTRMSGSNTTWPKYFEFYIEPQEENKVQIYKNEYEYNPEIKTYESTTAGFQPVGEPTYGLFSVEVTGGVSMPFAKQQRGNLALQLYDRQAIDQEALLNILDWPRKEETMQRMQQEKTEQMQAQNMANVAPTQEQVRQ
jgi:hypothetical protein